MEYAAIVIFFLMAAWHLTSFCLTVSRKNGFREQDVACTTGQLTGQTVERNAVVHRFAEQKQKKTLVTYTYCVDGETYHRQCLLLDRFQAMPASTKVIYQRKRPENAYLPDFEAADTKGMGGFYLISGLFFLLTGLLFLIFGV